MLSKSIERRVLRKPRITTKAVQAAVLSRLHSFYRHAVLGAETASIAAVRSLHVRNRSVKHEAEGVRSLDHDVAVLHPAHKDRVEGFCRLTAEPFADDALSRR